MEIFGFGTIAAILGFFWLKKRKGDTSIDFNTPLVEIKTPTNPRDIRKAIVANAISCIGLGVNSNRTAFEKLLGPPGKETRWDLDRPFRTWVNAAGQRQTEGVSTCGLVGEGIQRRVGSLCPTLYEPYDFHGNKAAIARFIQCSADWGAWQYHGRPVPLPGDYVVIGDGLATHALTLVAWEGNICHSVDGGQVDANGLQMVKAVTRTLANDALDGRKIYGYADCTKCQYGPTMLVPKGWQDVPL